MDCALDAVRVYAVLPPTNFIVDAVFFASREEAIALGTANEWIVEEWFFGADTLAQSLAWACAAAAGNWPDDPNATCEQIFPKADL